MNTVLITGTSSGIGRAAVQRFAAADWQVAATLRPPTDVPEWAEHPQITRYPLDVTDGTQATDTIQAAIDDFGHLDVLVNNADFGVFGAFEGATEEQIREQFDTNLFGPMRTIRAVLANHTELNEQGGDAEMVADVIYDAATDTGSSQLRYTAGADVSFFLTLRNFIPDRLFFWLVRSQLEPSSG
jgi:NAD(P)-dependent dehydrogenase (short-subunit alcohol dehydrogenase family)